MPIAMFHRQAPEAFKRLAVLESAQSWTYQTAVAVCQRDHPPARNCEGFQIALATRRVAVLQAQTSCLCSLITGSDDGTPTLSSELGEGRGCKYLIFSPTCPVQKMKKFHGQDQSW
jgi:hypothetical protein